MPGHNSTKPAEPSREKAASLPTPPGAYRDALQREIAGIDLNGLARDQRLLERLASGFRRAEHDAEQVARGEWELNERDARMVASQCSAAAGVWLMGGTHDPALLQRLLEAEWERARWTLRMRLEPAAARRQRCPFGRARPGLVVSLPRQLTESTIAGLALALEAFPGDFAVVTLDAVQLREIDPAGMGALARVVRFARDATNRPPVLRDASSLVAAYLRGVHLLRAFDVEES